MYALFWWSRSQPTLPTSRARCLLIHEWCLIGCRGIDQTPIPMDNQSISPDDRASIEETASPAAAGHPLAPSSIRCCGDTRTRELARSGASESLVCFNLGRPPNRITCFESPIARHGRSQINLSNWRTHGDLPQRQRNRAHTKGEGVVNTLVSNTPRASTSCNGTASTARRGTATST